MAFKHLGLTRWPFPIVPERSFCDFIADRTNLRGELGSLLRTLSRQEASSIHLLWSWFGAGKTHTLYYLANLLADQEDDSARPLHSIYSEFPKSPRSFTDVYRAFALGLDPDAIIDAYLEITTSSDPTSITRQLQTASPDLINALHVAATGRESDQITAIRWLHGESLPVSQYRNVGISQKINTVEEASRILAAITWLLSAAGKSETAIVGRVVWLLDEFQRIERAPPRVRDEINTGLHSAFNACPTGLSIVFSFSGRPQDSLPSWFSPELQDRIGRTKVMVLPPMNTEEALEFVRDVLEHFRTPDLVIDNTYFPFTEEAARTIVEDVQAAEELKPRAIMHAFNAVLQEADPKIEDGEIDVIRPTFARKVLVERTPLGDSAGH